MSLEEIQDILHKAIGLNFKSIGSTTILHAINERIESCQLENIENYLKEIKYDNAELKKLIEEVVIPETWFFRDIAPFKMLMKFVNDEWLPGKPDSPLRILSIPCATGEEPYSIAMALIDAGLTPSQIYIDAVDISQRNINACKKARYQKNSFRGVDPLIQNRFFRLRDDNYYHPDILIKAMVNFRQANILDSGYTNNQRPYDIVFCRNLLIYFDDKTQAHAINTLNKLLNPTGLLFVGHVETGRFINSKDWNISYKYPKAFALRKFADGERYPKKVIRNNNSTNNSSQIRKSITKPTRLKTETYRTTINKPLNKIKPANTIETKNSIPPPLPDMDYAKQLADQGKFTEAESICLDSLAINKQDAKAYFILALIQLASGDEQKSSEYFRNVIYLEPRNIEALMYLATLTEQQGDPRQAQQFKERIQRCHKRNQQQAQR